MCHALSRDSPATTTLEYEKSPSMSPEAWALAPSPAASAVGSSSAAAAAPFSIAARMRASTSCLARSDAGPPAATHEKSTDSITSSNSVFEITWSRDDGSVSHKERPALPLGVWAGRSHQRMLSRRSRDMR